MAKIIRILNHNAIIVHEAVKIMFSCFLIKESVLDVRSMNRSILPIPVRFMNCKRKQAEARPKRCFVI